MQAERDELVKRVFPHLRKICESRGVNWTEVDLRWGVTDEQRAEDKVLPLCLAEIHNCRPYFIGLLGERYGWVPESLPGELLESEGWLADLAGRSVTEIEILHGVLNNPEMPGQAFFYFRDPGFLSRLSAEADPANYQSEDPSAARKLQLLKDRIRNSGVRVREDYTDARALGQLVLKDFTEVIDHLYPAGATLNPLDVEAAEHESFVRHRLDVHVGRGNLLDHLDAHADGDGPPLALLGDSGVGKSALLANWIVRRRDQHAEEFVLPHFIGATQASADWASLIRRVMLETKRHFGITLPIPDDPKALRSAFPNWLHQAAAKGRVVLVLDGLDQLEERDQAQELAWLPEAIPAGVRLIVSTLPGPPLEEIQRRGWSTLTVEPLTATDRLQLIEDYLGQYRKSLGSVRAARLAEAPACANPLYLRALLEELRVFGVHEKLDEIINHYLAAPDPRTLFEMILARYEQDFEQERPGLVGDSMSLLWAARRGLSEAELLDLLGNGSLLPHVIWSPLYLAVERSLVNHSGRLTFFHDHLRQAVRDRYLDDETRQRRAHEKLADYFSASDLGARKVEELPWQLAEAGAWEKLYTLLADLDFLAAAQAAEPYQVKRYWARIEDNSFLRITDAYLPVIEAPEQHAEHALDVALLLEGASHWSEAKGLLKYLVRSYWKSADPRSLPLMIMLAENLRRQGNLDDALELIGHLEAVIRETQDPLMLVSFLRNKASVLRRKADFDGAMAALEEEGNLLASLDEPSLLAGNLNGRALILEQQGDFDAALVLFKEVERHARQEGLQDLLATSLNNQGWSLLESGAPDAALRLLKEAETFCRQLGDLDGLQRSLGNQAILMRYVGDPTSELRLLEEQEEISRRLGSREWLAKSLTHQAAIHQSRKGFDRAARLYREAEELWTLIGNDNYTRHCRTKREEVVRADEFRIAYWSKPLQRVTSTLQAMSGHDPQTELENVFEEARRSAGDNRALAAAKNSAAKLLIVEGKLEEALDVLNEGAAACRQTNDGDDLLQENLNYQTVILEAAGEFREALERHRELERMIHFADEWSLAVCLNNQAMILKELGDFSGAVQLLEKIETLTRNVGDEAGLYRCLGNQASIKADGLRELGGAIALYRKLEEMLERAGDRNGLRFCLARLFELYSDLDSGRRANETMHRLLEVMQDS